MAAMRVDPAATARDRILGAAGSFTGVWALAWLGATTIGAGPAVQGGFAVGGVMASSGLTVLWWKVSALKELRKETDPSEGEAPQEKSPEASSGQA